MKAIVAQDLAADGKEEWETGPGWAPMVLIREIGVICDIERTDRACMHTGFSPPPPGPGGRYT